MPRPRLVLAIAAASLLLARDGFVQTSTLVIEHVTLVDGTGRTPVPDATIVIENGRFSRIVHGPVSMPNASVIDGRGRFLIPGLVDVHVHIAGGGDWGGGLPIQPEQERRGLRALHSYLYAGVTTIFDAGNRPDFILRLRDRERAGVIQSPRIFATGGTVTSPNGHGGPYYIESWPGDRATLDEHIALGPDLLKIGQDEHGWGTRPLITQLPTALLQEIIRYYHANGIRTTVHVSNERAAWDVIYAGADTLAHPVIQAPVSEAYVNMMAVKRVPTASTLTIGDSYSRLAEHPEFLDQPIYRDTFEPEDRQRLRTDESTRLRTDRWAAWLKVMTPVAQENLRRLHQIGDDIVALGTDQSAGAAVHRECELLAAAGIKPLDVLVIATRNAARFLGKLDTLGTIEPGKIADAVLLDADPTEHVTNLRRIELVIKDGRVVDRSQLDLPVNRPPATTLQ